MKTKIEKFKSKKIANPQMIFGGVNGDDEGSDDTDKDLIKRVLGRRR